MRLPDAEEQDALAFWGFGAFVLLVSVFLGKLAADYSSPWLPAAVAAVFTGLLTFYSPRTALSFLVFAMLLSPKIRGTQISSDSSHGNVVLRFDDVLLVVIFIAWIAKKALAKGTAFLMRTPINLPIFLYTSVYVISTSFAVMRGSITPLRATFYVLKYVEYFFLYFMTVNIVENEEDMRKYLWAGWVTAVVVTIYGYVQIPGGGRISAPFEDFVGDAKGSGEANTLGGYYLVVFGSLLAFYTQGSARAAGFAMGSLLFMLPPFAMTLSRSAYMGISAALGYLVVSTQRRRLSLIMGVAALMFILFSVPSIRDKVFKRVSYTFTGGGYATEQVSLGPLGKINLEASTMARVYSWKKILFTAFPKHPFFGGGVTSVGLVDAQYPLVLGEAGLIGFCLFLIMLYRIWFVASQLYQKAQTELQKVLAFGVMTSLVGLMFQSFSTNTFIIVRIMEPFWFLTALAARSLVNIQKAEQKLLDPEPAEFEHA